MPLIRTICEITFHLVCLTLVVSITLMAIMVDTTLLARDLLELV